MENKCLKNVYVPKKRICTMRPVAAAVEAAVAPHLLGRLLLLGGLEGATLGTRGGLVGGLGTEQGGSSTKHRAGSSLLTRSG